MSTAAVTRAVRAALSGILARAAAVLAPGEPAPAPAGRRTVLCPHEPPRLPRPARPTPPERHEPPLGEAVSPLVRPYVIAHEEQLAQRQRRTALALALDGVDTGPWVIHGVRVGTAAPPDGGSAC